MAPCSVANPHAAPIYSAPASLGAQHSASQSPVGQPPVHSPPARHASLREQPVQRPQAYPEQQRPYSVHVPREGREDTRAPDPAYTRHQPAAAAAAVATARGSRQPCGQGAPEGCYGTYVQQRDAQVQRPERLQQAAVAALVGSMGALSVSQQQRQQQLLAASQPTLVGSAITMPMPHRRTPPAPQPLASAATIAGAASSATLVRAQGSASASAMPQPRLDGPGLPVWAAINASAFPAYQHRVAVPRSSLGGTKYAVVVGINYYGMEYSQTANINSAHTIRDLLMRRYGYREQNIVLLSDDQKSEKQHPTHRNITGTIRHVMGKVRPNDAVFFYFCGLGRLPVQLSDRRTEVLGSIRRLRSDYLLPCDFESAGAIDAAYLHRHLVHQLPPSVRLTALLNCIISETGLGVPYKHTSPSGAPVVTNAVAGCNLFEAGVRPSTQASASFGDLSQRVEASLVQQQRQGDACAEAVRRIAQSSGDIIVFGWDRDYANPKHRHFLSHTPSTQLGGYWAAAMESSMRARGGAAATFGDVLRYMQASTSELLMLPFIASGRRISLDDTFMI
ncbi:Ca(2+)-dependent cysteine protease [Coemansia javaensis]|uniref:Ca(2+)-dependent cysteine protease n=1 Tax=Coemansia javaensis TaxID=2761396 RepID=A0A9W8HNJ8_9FUNG|nr:Ca(2+)-dependent cysteine protease [Coemansia javaensis]